MWFDTWSEITRVLLSGTAAYLSLLVLLRLSVIPDAQAGHRSALEGVAGWTGGSDAGPSGRSR